MYLKKYNRINKNIAGSYLRMSSQIVPYVTGEVAQEGDASDVNQLDNTELVLASFNGEIAAIHASLDASLDTSLLPATKLSGIKTSLSAYIHSTGQSCKRVLITGNARREFVHSLDCLLDEKGTYMPIYNELLDKLKATYATSLYQLLTLKKQATDKVAKEKLQEIADVLALQKESLLEALSHRKNCM